MYNEAGRELRRARIKRGALLILVLPVCLLLAIVELYILSVVGVNVPRFVYGLLWAAFALNLVLVWIITRYRTKLLGGLAATGLTTYLAGTFAFLVLPMNLTEKPVILPGQDINTFQANKSSTLPSLPTLNEIAATFNKTLSIDIKDVITPSSKAAYWNAWFTKDDQPVPGGLRANSEYDFALDLSAFDYAALRKTSSSSSLPVDTPLQALLSNTDAKSITLTIRPVIGEDSGLLIVGGSPPPYSMPIKLDELRAPKVGAAEQFAKDPSITTSALSKQVRAGWISFRMRALAAGCATMAFSVFSGFKPLDHLVQRVVIHEEDGAAPPCAADDVAASSSFTGGLDALRDAALGAEVTSGPVLGDAALHIFDTGESGSTVVFVDGRKGPRQSFYGWQTQSSIVEYLRRPEFQALIGAARKAAANMQPGSYVAAGNELWSVIFSAKASSGTKAEVEMAKAAFQDLVRNSPTPPVIIVRIASSAPGREARSLFAPIGILGASGPDAVLGKPIIVIQPMERERFVSQDICIASWTFALPDKLEKVPDTVMDLSHLPSPLPGSRIKDMAGFKPFLADDRPLASLPASGLVLLAHQNQGFLWFDAEINRVIKEQINRPFGPGSVGILAACSTADTAGRNSELLQKLNEQGLDTLIASPFTLEATYGVKFSYSFVEAINDAIAGRKTPTVFELFNSAIAKTATKFAAINNGSYEERGLEYVLLGNPAISLCPLAPTPRR